MKASFLNAPIAATLALAAAILLLWQDLSHEFESRLAAVQIPKASAVQALGEADIEALPAPIRRYLRSSGQLGKVPVRAVQITFDAELFRSPETTGMRGIAHQIDMLNPYRRLFFIEMTMNGLPLSMLHDYKAEQATVQIRLANVIDLQKTSGPLLSQAATVTLLSDICTYAPSALVGPDFLWQAIDENQAGVTFTNGTHKVHATLTVDDSGHLVDFKSVDGGALQSDGRLRPQTWSTLLSEFTSYDGRVVPGHGEATWQYPGGAFTYGKFTVLDVKFN